MDELIRKISNHNFHFTFAGEIETKSEIFNPDTDESHWIELWNPEKKPEALSYLERSGKAFGNIKEVCQEINLLITEVQQIRLLGGLLNSSKSIIVRNVTKSWIGCTVTCYESSLCLINEVLELGYRKRSLNRANLESNAHITENSELDNIRKQVRQSILAKLNNHSGALAIDALNNKIKHMGEFESLETSSISMLELFAEWNTIMQNLEEGQDPETEIDKLISDLTQKLLDLSATQLNGVIKLLDYLEPIFSRRIHVLKGSDLNPSPN